MFSFGVKQQFLIDVPTDNSLLLEVEVPFLKDGNVYYIEQQALNGVKKWMDNFDRLTLCAYAVTREKADPTMQWESPEILLQNHNIQLVELPNGFHPKDFLFSRQAVEKIFQNLIPKHQYLCFCSIGGIGKWGNIGVDVALAQSRAYSVWFDWVVEAMPRVDNGKLTRKLKNIFEKAYKKKRVELAVSNADLGLFHGKTVFDGYKNISKNPQLVHDIHTSKDDVISDQTLSEKLARIPRKETLNLGYIGRVDAMKGPKDWVNIIEKFVTIVGRDRVTASWLGSGLMLDEMRDLVIEKQLTDVINFKGLITNRSEVLKFLRELDVFVFCHLTPESPRNLIESIISATPIVGYESAYATDLVGDRGGAMLTEISNIDLVVENLCSLAEDQLLLQELTVGVAKSRNLYNSEAVFKHRSDLIKQYIKPPKPL